MQLYDLYANMAVREMQTCVHHVCELKWLAWTACWCVDGHFLTLLTHGSIAFWVLLVRFFTISVSVLVYEPAHVDAAPISQYFCSWFFSTGQNFINVSELHDGWSLPWNYRQMIVHPLSSRKEYDFHPYQSWNQWSGSIWHCVIFPISQDSTQVFFSIIGNVSSATTATTPQTLQILIVSPVGHHRGVGSEESFQNQS